MSRPFKSTEKFIEEAREKHGVKFNYDKVDYQGAWKPVIITCPKHGDFSQTPTMHLSGVYGCTKCGGANTNTHTVNGICKRICSRCKLPKELSLLHFVKDKRKACGLGYVCRVCSAKSLREKRELMVNRVREIKEQTPCTDCGVTYPHYILDFDHLEDDKTDGLSEMMHVGSSWGKIQAEIDKCEVVCSNCHRKRSWLRMHPAEK